MGVHLGKLGWMTGAAITLILTSGCAGRPRPAGPPPVSDVLFISPHGEAFRAKPGGPSPLDLWWTQADADHDGRISREEFLDDAKAFFVKADLDHDGQIVPVEVSELQTKYARETLGFYGPPPKRARVADAPVPQRAGGPGPAPAGGLDAARDDQEQSDAQARVRVQGAAAFGLLGEPEPIMAADVDFSRRVTPEEAAAAAERRFAKLDANADGFFTRHEIPARFAKSGSK